MPAAPFGLSEEDNNAIDAIFDNKELMDFMASGISNAGEEEADEVMLARAGESIQAFASYEPSWWKKKSA